MAKDVAAFANAQGGTILVGAVEDRERKHLARYNPLPEPLAAKIVHGYEQSVRDRCRPTPILEIKILSRDGGAVVAVNVWPFPGQPVGARYEKEAFMFPLRSGAETVYLQPDQLPMLTLPTIRRVAILLDSIPTTQRDQITLLTPNPAGSRFAARRVQFSSSLEEVVMRNTVLFLDLKHRSTICVPASAIDHIWGNDGKWFVSMSMHLDQLISGVLVGTPT